MSKNIILSLLCLIIIVSGIFFVYKKYSVSSTKTTDNQNTSQVVGMANPASVFCINNGGSLSIKENEQGVSGVCTFPNKQTCDEWALFRGECNVEGVSNSATYTSADKKVFAVFRIKSNTLVLNAPDLGINFLDLNIAESGSGARYLSSDGLVEFWEHQGEATITMKGKQMFIGEIMSK